MGGGGSSISLRSTNPRPLFCLAMLPKHPSTRLSETLFSDSMLSNDKTLYTQPTFHRLYRNSVLRLNRTEFIDQKDNKTIICLFAWQFNTRGIFVSSWQPDCYIFAVKYYQYAEQLFPFFFFFFFLLIFLYFC